MSKKPKEAEKENHERWLVTYADLMNLLLILFIILYAMSQVDKEKATKVAASVREGFGYVEDGGSGEKIGSGSGLYEADFTTDAADTSADSMAAGEASAEASGNELYWAKQSEAFQKFYDDIITLLQDNNLENMVDVSIDDRGVVISFKDNVLFRSGQADLSSSSMELIDSIGTMLLDLNYTFILVEGHTDTDPIHTYQYKDNMDLSTQRAANVWRELVKSGLSADTMASIGYGEFDPVAPNDTRENKAKNRRVVITILRSEIENSQEFIIGSAATHGN